jgi:hypothetical protein
MPRKSESVTLCDVLNDATLRRQRGSATTILLKAAGATLAPIHYLKPSRPLPVKPSASAAHASARGTPPPKNYLIGTEGQNSLPRSQGDRNSDNVLCSKPTERADTVEK